MIFRVRAEQRLPAAHANERAFRFRVRELATEGRFSSLLAGDVVLLVRQLGFPLGILFLYFVAHDSILRPVSGEFTARNFERAALDGGEEPFNNQNHLDETNRVTLFRRGCRRYEGGGRPRDFARRNSLESSRPNNGRGTRRR